jgi:CubicO group peptidase (beta-lactamase class C family)
MPTDTITLTGSATDDGLPTGSTLSYTWALASGPNALNGTPGAIIATPNAASTSVRLTGGAGDYTFNLTVSDGALNQTASLTVTLGANPNLYPAAIAPGANGWTVSTPAAEGLDVTKLDAARDYSLNTGVQTLQSGAARSEAGYVIYKGKLVYQWGDETKLFEMKSTTKSMGGLALLLGIDEGKVALTDKAIDRLPGVFGTDPPVTLQSNVTPGSLNNITVLQLATHTAGFSKSDLAGGPPRTLDNDPGTAWAYSDQGLNWLADVLTQSYNRDLKDLLFERVYNGLGIRPTADLVWRDNLLSRPGAGGVAGTLNGLPRRELASGINANVNAMARVGLLMLHQGAWGNAQVLSNAAVATAHTPPPEVTSITNIVQPADYPDATTNYGVLWWTNANGRMATVPTDAFWAWGLHEVFIIVIPSKDLVIARAADAGWHAGNGEAWNADYSILEPFLGPIAASVPATP